MVSPGSTNKSGSTKCALEKNSKPNGFGQLFWHRILNNNWCESLSFSVTCYILYNSDKYMTIYMTILFEWLITDDAKYCIWLDKHWCGWWLLTVDNQYRRQWFIIRTVLWRVFEQFDMEYRIRKSCKSYVKMKTSYPVMNDTHWPCCKRNVVDPKYTAISKYRQVYNISRTLVGN